jgi:L-ascorbate metabolism protein UlaG (beta-lactamase superfamily)
MDGPDTPTDHSPGTDACGTIGRMEITWLGETCVRLRGREGVVVADAYRSVAGPTGRSLTADICTYSHAEQVAPWTPGGVALLGTSALGVAPPTSLEPAFLIDAPGEYEVHEVLVTGVRTYRDDSQGSDRGVNTAFVYELDGLDVIHLGDIGHVLTEQMLGEIGSVHIALIPVGGALGTARTVELVTGLGANLVVPMPVGDDSQQALERFLKEMSVTDPQPVPRLTVSISTVPQETTVVVLEQRARS